MYPWLYQLPLPLLIAIRSMSVTPRVPVPGTCREPTSSPKINQRGHGCKLDRTWSNMVADSWNDSSENLSSDLKRCSGPCSMSSQPLPAATACKDKCWGWSFGPKSVWPQPFHVFPIICICMAARATRCHKPHQWRNDEKRAEMPRKLHR